MNEAPMAAALLAHLDRMVPMEIFRQRGLDPQARIDAARAAWNPVRDCEGKGKAQLTGGAALLFGGPTWLRELNAIVIAIGAMSYQPGGVTVFGRHWCTDHKACTDAERYARLQSQRRRVWARLTEAGAREEVVLGRT